MGRQGDESKEASQKTCLCVENIESAFCRFDVKAVFYKMSSRIKIMAYKFPYGYALSRANVLFMCADR